MSRIKRIPRDQFSEIQNRNWSIVKLEDDTIPEIFKGIPESLLYSVYASGGPFPGVLYSDSLISSANLIGGIDVFRKAPDDPVELNKDWYPLISFSDTDTMFLVHGPISDSEHWIDDLPDRFTTAEILAVPPKVKG